eukprot:5115337-Pyramimonas_sp.AAC.1
MRGMSAMWPPSRGALSLGIVHRSWSLLICIAGRLPFWCAAGLRGACHWKAFVPRVLKRRSRGLQLLAAKSL